MAQHVIRIDDQVAEELRRRAEAGETPNAVIRRTVFGLPSNQARRSDALVPFARLKKVRRGGREAES